MTPFRYTFQSRADLAALARFADRLDHPRFSSWPLEVEWSRPLPGAPDGDDFPVRRRRLLLYEGEEIRAFQNFFEHELFVDGNPLPFVWPNGPLSESVVDNRYAACWPMVLAHSLKLQPLHLLMGGTPVIHSIVERMGWRRWGGLPCFILPVRPRAILREMAWFRRSRARRLAASFLAATGLGSLLAYACSGRKRRHARPMLDAQESDAFGAWADRIWAAQAPRYAAITRRDAATLNRLYRPGDRRLRRFHVRQGTRDVGWFVYATQLAPSMIDFLGFGRLRVGVLIDTLGAPEDAEALLRIAVECMVRDGVDLIFGHWSHRAWQTACAAVGFIRRVRDYPVFVSKAARQHAGFSRPMDEAHFTEADNDGPFYLEPELAGTVCSAARCVPIEGAEVSGWNESGQVVGTARTGADGRWVFAGTDRPATLEFRAPAFVSKRLAVRDLPAKVRLLDDQLTGYQQRLWASPGETVTAHVHAPEPFTAQLRRHGQQRTTVLDLGEQPAFAQQVPDGDFVATGLTWHGNVHYQLPHDARPGLYSLALRSAHGEFTIPLVVATRPETRGRRSKLLVLTSTNTWLAYNFWGGRSVYRNMENGGRDNAGYFVPSWRFHAKSRLKRLMPPGCKRLLKRLLGKTPEQLGPAWALERLAICRPFPHCALEGDDPGAPFTSHLAAAEWRLLAWLEREGHDYDLLPDFALHTHPALLDNYRAILLNSHSEYWSRQMHDHLKHFHEQQQGWILNVSGNTMYREVALFTDGSLRCRGLSFDESYADETQLLGVRFTQDDINTCAPYRIVRPSHWAFAGIALRAALLFGERALNQNTPARDGEYDPARPCAPRGLEGTGASGWETDKRSRTAPAGTVVIAKGLNRFGGADMIVREPHGTRGGLFSASSIVFSSALLIDPVASGLLTNVLKHALCARASEPTSACASNQPSHAA